MKNMVLASSLLASATFAAAPASAQTFQNAPYYASPSWDQQLPPAQRFIVLTNWGNAAVLDRETGLVWERSPVSGSASWFNAFLTCRGERTGNRRGWRVASEEELASLFEGFYVLPAGHPFQGVPPSSLLWTASSSEENPENAWVLLTDAGVFPKSKREEAAVWCVRGGAGAQNPR